MLNSTIPDNRIFKLCISISLILFTALLWFIYKFDVTTTQATRNFWAFIPATNAILNLASCLALTGGIIAIKNANKEIHKRFMLAAFFFSTLFLANYLAYHAIFPDQLFLGKGWIRPIYFSILITHILATFFGLPFILGTFTYAFLKRFDSHKKLARLTWPIWMYISITGVLIYVILNAYS